LESNRQAILFS